MNIKIIPCEASFAFDEFARSTKNRAEAEGVVFQYEFGTKTVLVSVDTDVDKLSRDYDVADDLGWDTIGPTSKDELSEEELRIIGQKDREREAEQEQYKSEQSAIYKLEAEKLMVSFPKNEDEDEAKLMAWLRDYANNAKYIYWPKSINSWLVRRLLELGYRSNENLDLPEKEYRKRAVFARVVIGKVLFYLERDDTAPIQVISNLVDDYFKLPEEKTDGYWFWY